MDFGNRIYYRTNRYYYKAAPTKIVKKKGKYGLKRKKGNSILLPCEYDAVFFDSTNIGVEFRTASKIAYYDIETGNLLPQRYLCEPYRVVHDDNSNRYILVKYTSDGPLGVYDFKKEKELVPVRYKYIIGHDARYFWVSKTKEIDLSANNPGNLYDIASQQEIDFSSYSRVKRLNNSRLWVSKNDLWGL